MTSTASTEFKKVKVITLEVLPIQIQMLDVPSDSLPLCVRSVEAPEGKVLMIDIMSTGSVLRESIRVDIVSNEQETIIPTRAVYLNSLYHSIGKDAYRLHAFYTRQSRLVIAKSTKSISLGWEDK